MGLWFALTTGMLAAGCVLAGVWYSLSEVHDVNVSDRWIRVMALGTGVLLAALLLDFLPDAWMDAGGLAAWGLTAGVLLMLTVIRISDRWFLQSTRPSNGDAAHPPALHDAGIDAVFTPASAFVLMFSLSSHTLLEGFSLATMSRTLSLSSLTFAAALLIHKLPEGVLWGLSIIGAFPEALRQAGKHLTIALIIPSVCVLVGTIAGVFLMPVLSPAFLSFLMTLTAGALLYICLAELLPALRDHAATPGLNTWFFGGVLLMLVPIGIGKLAGV